MRSGIRPNSHWGEVIRQRIADQVKLIRHWKIYNTSYTLASNRKATWFIDPPYNCKAGKRYRYHNIDYSALSHWCQNRKGQVMVCEIHGANWLSFQSFRVTKATTGYSREVLWKGGI